MTDKPWLHEDGRHVDLDDYVSSLPAVESLFSQIAKELQMSRGRVERLAVLGTLRAMSVNLRRLAEAYNDLASYEKQRAEEYSAYLDECRAREDERDKKLDRMYEIAERQADDLDEPWRDDE